MLYRFRERYNKQMEKAKQLFQSTMVVILLFGLGKVMGLVRGGLVSQAFGTSLEFDAFTAANQLPELFVTLLAGGALAAAFIPVYSRYLGEGEETKLERLALANSVLTFVFLLLTIVSIGGALGANWLTRNLLVPGYSVEQQLLTAGLMRIILIQTTLFGISGVISSILNAHQHFALPALAPVALDIGYILGLYLFVPKWGIYGLAWGTVVAGVLHIVIQLPALYWYRISYRPRLGWRIAGVREIGWLMLPRLVTLGVIQLADLFIIRLTSELPPQSTSAYFYAYMIMQMPETLFATTIGIVLFPTMAELFNQGDIEGMKRRAMDGLRVVWFLTIPAAVGLAFIGDLAIKLLLERGAFGPESTALVYSILLVFTVRIVSEGSLEIGARLFYAQHDTWRPMYLYMGWLLINWGLAYLFVAPFGVRGLALASTVAFSCLAIGLFVWNRKRLGRLGGYRLLLVGTRSLLASGVMGLFLWWGRHFVVGEGLLILGSRLGLLIVIGGVIYLFINHLLGGQELGELKRMIGR